MRAESPVDRVWYVIRVEPYVSTKKKNTNIKHTDIHLILDEKNYGNGVWFDPSR